MLQKTVIIVFALIANFAIAGGGDGDPNVYIATIDRYTECKALTGNTDEFTGDTYSSFFPVTDMTLEELKTILKEPLKLVKHKGPKGTILNERVGYFVPAPDSILAQLPQLEDQALDLIDQEAAVPAGACAGGGGSYEKIKYDGKVIKEDAYWGARFSDGNWIGATREHHFPKPDKTPDLERLAGVRLASWLTGEIRQGKNGKIEVRVHLREKRFYRCCAPQHSKV